MHVGRWSGWKEYSLITTGRLDPSPWCWDGGSPSYYLHNWMALTDYTLWSPQVESMNWVFALKEVYRTRPEFWFEDFRPGTVISRDKATTSGGSTPAGTALHARTLRGVRAVRPVVDPGPLGP